MVFFAHLACVRGSMRLCIEDALCELVRPQSSTFSRRISKHCLFGVA